MLPDLDKWLSYFAQNALDAENICWDSHETLTAEEYHCIKDSIAAFQLGEYSEGAGLVKFAEHYAQSHASRPLVDITRLFIKEEQKHAFLLKRFMEQQHIPVIKKNWTDTVFRRLRKNVGYELSITVLITAEIIALVYYKALRACTHSIVLSAICDKILRDESAHVKYESGLLNYLHGRKPTGRRFSARFRHQFLYGGTVLVVYYDHRRVLRRGGYNLAAFWRDCWAEFFACFGTPLPRDSLQPTSASGQPH